MSWTRFAGSSGYLNYVNEISACLCYANLVSLLPFIHIHTYVHTNASRVELKKVCSFSLREKVVKGCYAPLSRQRGFSSKYHTENRLKNVYVCIFWSLVRSNSHLRLHPLVVKGHVLVPFTVSLENLSRILQAKSCGRAVIMQLHCQCIFYEILFSGR